MSRATMSVPVSDTRVLIGYCDSVRRISAIGRLRSMRTTSPPSFASSISGRNRAGLCSSCLEEHALGVDLAEDLAVGRARDADADRHARAVARQADDAHVMAEILAAELRADPVVAGQRQDLLLEAGVAEGLAVAVAGGRQIVEIAAARQLHRLQVHLGRGAADDDGEVIGRAGRGAERLDLLVDELDQRRMVQHRWRLLEEKGSCWPSRRPWR